MTPAARAARGDLAALAARGAPLRFDPQAPPRDRSDARSAAVLILFGELDRVDARSAVPAVSAALDVLLIRRAQGMRHHPGQIAFPGGGREPGDRTPAATAVREAREETGLDPAGVTVLGELPALYVPVSHNLVTPVLAWWQAPTRVAADRTESVEVFRVPVADLLDPAARGVSVLRRGPRVYRAPAFRLAPALGGHTVWGFTGMVLASLFDELGWSVPWDRATEFPVQ